MKTIWMLLFLCLFYVEALATEKPKVVWPVFYYPPMYSICDGAICGYGSDIIDLISQAMPEYSHDKVLIPMARHFETLKDGKPYLLYGLYRTAEREAYMRYSLPCGLNPANVVVITREKAVPHLRGQKINLRSLLGDLSLVRGTTHGASYGVEIDAILQKYGAVSKPWGVHGRNSEHRLFEMLKKNRVDWFIHNPMTLHYFLGENRLAKDAVMVYEIDEINTPFTVGYIAAPNTPWGVDMIRSINVVLADVLFTDDFYHTLEANVPDALRASFRHAYEQLVLEPAKAYRSHGALSVVPLR